MVGPTLRDVVHAADADTVPSSDGSMPDVPIRFRSNPPNRLGFQMFVSGHTYRLPFQLVDNSVIDALPTILLSWRAYQPDGPPMFEYEIANADPDDRVLNNLPLAIRQADKLWKRHRHLDPEDVQAECFLA